MKERPESKDKEEGEAANWGEKNNSCQNDKATKPGVRKGLKVGRIEDDLQKRWNNSRKIATVE